MKKFLVLFIISVFTIALKAQPKDFKTELYIGAKGGMTFSKVRFYPSIVESFLQGNTGGIVFRLISEPHIGFQVEVNYTQKGWNEDSTKYFHRLNYINIPIMTHVNLGDKAFRVTLNLGPEAAFRISDEQGFNGTEVVSGDSGYRDYYGKPTDTKVDFLFTAGLGMEYHMKGGSSLVFEGRAYYSLPNLFNPDNYPFKVSQSNGGQVTLGYLFQLNKKKKAVKHGLMKSRYSLIP